jgi:DNA gyrase/topoisomerase IV subunit B
MPSTSSDLLRQIRQRPGMYVGDTGGYGLHRLPLLQAPRPDGAPEPFLLVSPYEDLALVNALASEFEVTLAAGGSTWLQSFRCGAPAGPPRALSASEGGSSPFRGTRIHFVPDRSIFERPRLFLLGLSWRMEELAALHERVSFRLFDDVRPFETHHRFERGLVDYAARLSAPALPLHAPWSFEGRHDTTRIRVSLQWCETPGSRVSSWVNQLRASGGTHLKGLIGGIHGALHHHAEATGRTSEFGVYIPSVLTEGLTVRPAKR